MAASPDQLQPAYPAAQAGAARWLASAGIAALAFGLAGCSVKQIAIRQLGSALSEGAGAAFAAESDPEFAGKAVPFSLKLVESLLFEQPDNQDLLIAAAGGFTQYAFVWVQQPADFLEAENLAEAQRQRERARAFYLRAHGYARHALELRHPPIAQSFDRDPDAALAGATRDDVELLYWAALSLGGAVSLGKNDPELLAQLPQLEALVDRAYALDPEWHQGALLELLMSYELARPGAGADAIARARGYFERTLALAGGHRASPLVAFAESVCVQEQNKAEFLALLERALAIDPAATPSNRLANTVMQQRARWLLSRVDELFVE